MSRRAEYPAAIRDLIAQFRRMPGVGPRSAERIALWIVQKRDARPLDIAAAVSAVAERVRPCVQCGYFSEEELCVICQDTTRDRSKLCVVEQPTDILPLERSGAFEGLYHSMGGRISPLDHVGPEDLRTAELLTRVRGGEVREVILALSADVEGEATANYLAEVLAQYPVDITRIAQGLPAGGGLEYADDLTLSRALSGRRKMR